MTGYNRYEVLDEYYSFWYEYYTRQVEFDPDKLGRIISKISDNMFISKENLNALQDIARKESRI